MVLSVMEGLFVKFSMGMFCFKRPFEGATKFHLMHSLYMVIILFNMHLYIAKSAFSTYSFKKLVSCLSVFCFLSMLF